jgi:hypothetical protein
MVTNRDQVVQRLSGFPPSDRFLLNAKRETSCRWHPLHSRMDHIGPVID